MSKELTETIIESRKVQDGGSHYTVTLPKNAVSELGIEPGSSVFFTGQAGDTSLELLTADQAAELMRSPADS